MPRLVSKTTGVVVNVSDEVAARLVGYTPVEKPAAKPAEAAPAPAAKRAPVKSDK